MLNLNQKTINNQIYLEGISLHSGNSIKMKLFPAPPNHGIIFKRTDLKKNNLIEANFNNVKEAMLCTKIENENKVSISTIEHLMGALCGEGIDNLLVEVNSSELPIMDGSAKEFINKIREVGIKNYDTPKKFIKVLKKIEHRNGNKFISLEPNDDDLIIDFEIIYKNPLIGKQRKSISLFKDNLDKIYNSRTFCLYEDIEQVKKLGLGKGGSLENAVVVKGEKVVNEMGLRYENEFVMHKILDCIGDLSLANYRILGKLTCSQGGHKMTNDFLKKFFLDKNNFSLVEIKENKLPNSVVYNKPLAATA